MIMVRNVYILGLDHSSVTVLAAHRLIDGRLALELLTNGQAPALYFPRHPTKKMPGRYISMEDCTNQMGQGQLTR